MKKLLSTTLAGLAFLAIPTLAQAQYDVNITVHSSTISAGGNGGQFAATATGGLGDLLVYCVDNTRFFHYGQTSAYRVFTFNQYVATTFSAGSHFGVGYQTLNELNNMAANAGIIGSGGSGKDAAQTSTWAMFNSNGDTAPAELAFDNSDWLILVSVDAINQDNFQGGVKGSQTFITTSTVPEPSTYVLMASGLMLIGFYSRRRRQA